MWTLFRQTRRRGGFGQAQAGAFIGLLGLVLASAIAPVAAQNGCELKMADIETLLADRQSTLGVWQTRLKKIDAELETVAERVMNGAANALECEPDVVAALVDLGNQTDSAIAASPLNSAAVIESESARVFGCLVDISFRVAEARDSAAAANDALRVQRYNDIADRLMELDRSFTEAMVQAEAASSKAFRLQSEIAKLDEFCKADEF